MANNWASSFVFWWEIGFPLPRQLQKLQFWAGAKTLPQDLLRVVIKSLLFPSHCEIKNDILPGA